MISKEEFARLSIEEMKKEIIKLIGKVPEEDIEELYYGIKNIIDSETQEK